MRTPTEVGQIPGLKSRPEPDDPPARSRRRDRRPTKMAAGLTVDPPAPAAGRRSSAAAPRPRPGRLSPLLASGTVAGGYRIEGLLGRGGMGVVYEATQLSLGRTRRAQAAGGRLGADDSFRARFRREAPDPGRDRPSHIVSIYEAGELDGEGLYIAMQLVRGPNLKQVIRDGELDARARGLRLLTPDRRRARHRARGEPGAPRHQAAEHARRAPRPRLPGRLRAHAPPQRHRLHPDRRRSSGRSTTRRPSRSRARRRRPAQRPLLVRRGRLRVPDGIGPVPRPERGRGDARPPQ